MKDKLCIYICNSLVPEVEHLLHTGDYPDVDLKSFAANCTAKPVDDKAILELIGNKAEEYDKIIVIVSTCLRNSKTGLKNFNNIEVVQLEQCFELLFSLPSIYHFIKQGNYLVTNGWLRNYKQHVREWGFNPKTAKNYFGESLKRLMLLETGLPGEYQANLEALSEYMGLPYEVFPIGISHLQKSLDAIVYDWRNEKERISLNDSIARFSRETSEHLLIFNHLKELVNVTDPDAIIEKISSLCDLLFAPGHLIFEGFIGSENYENIIMKKGDSPHNPDHSFSVVFEFNHELFGELKIVNIKFPKFMPQYLSMASTIGQMGGLAISNAKRFVDLKAAKQKIEESGAHFKSLMKQSPSVIEIYDLEGYQRSVNKAYEKLWGFPASHTVGKFNLFQSDEVKNTGLINYIERAYKGESVTVPVYKFDPTGNNEAHGLGRVRWLSTQMYPLKNQNDKVQSVVITHEDVTEQKIAEENLADKNEKFKMLSRAATEMLQIETLDNIYHYVVESLHEQYPNCVILFLLVDEENKKSWLTDIKGISQKLINRTIRMSGYNYLKKKFDIDQSLLKKFKTGKLHHFKQGLSEFSGYQFPDFAAKAIEKLLGIQDIYTIGIIKDEKLHATIHFFNRDKLPITDNDYIESFVMQAGIIIDRKLVELSVVKSEKHFRAIFEDSPIGIALINSLNGKIAEVNNKFASIAGRTSEEMMTIDWMSITHPDDVQEDLDNMARLNTGQIKGFNMHKRYIKPNGEVVWVNMTIAPVGASKSGVPMHLTMIEDITETKKAEEELHRLSQAVTQSPVSIVITDLEGNVKFANPVVSTITGYEYSELIGQNTRIFSSGNTTKEEYKNLWETIESGKTWKGEFLNKKKNEDVYWEDAIISPLKNKEGEIINYMAIKQDITKLKEATNQIVSKNQKLNELNATKDKFFSIISHDLRSPLSSILNLTDLMTDETYNFSEDDIKSFSQSLHKTADSTYKLLENLLEWSRLQRGIIQFNPEKIAILDFFNSCDPSVFEKAKNKNVKLDMKYNEDLIVFADENMLRTIMRNVLSNAIKFTKPKGKVLTEVSKTKQGKVLFTVKDSGIGMPPEMTSKLFDVAENVSRPGTDDEPSSGLGLILCKEFVDKHGGNIWVESEEGKGSTFYFTI
jgi:PAS domain S-box-containing protein